MSEYLYHRLPGGKALKHRREHWQDCDACWLIYVVKSIGKDVPAEPPEEVIAAADVVTEANQT